MSCPVIYYCSTERFDSKFTIKKVGKGLKVYDLNVSEEIKQIICDDLEQYGSDYEFDNSLILSLFLAFRGSFGCNDTKIIGPLGPVHEGIINNIIGSEGGVNNWASLLYHHDMAIYNTALYDKIGG